MLPFSLKKKKRFQFVIGSNHLLSKLHFIISLAFKKQVSYRTFIQTYEDEQFICLYLQSCHACHVCVYFCFGKMNDLLLSYIILLKSKYLLNS